MTAISFASTHKALKPLKGVRVLTLALNLPGPAAVMRLQAMGATTKLHSCLQLGRAAGGAGQLCLKWGCLLWWLLSFVQPRHAQRARQAGPIQPSPYRSVLLARG